MNKKGRGELQDKVPEPVGGGGQGNTLGTNGQRVDLADNDPGGGTPGGGKAKDVKAHKNDQAGAGGLGAGQGSADGADDELADQHKTGTPDEQLAAAKLLDAIEGDRGGDDVDQVGDERDEEGVLDARLLEEGGTVVEDEVDARQLLEHLQKHADEHAAEVAAGAQAAEAVGPAGLRDGQLVLVVGLDLGQLVLEVVAADWLAAQPRQRRHGVLHAALLDVPAGRLGQQEEADGEDEGPDELWPGLAGGNLRNVFLWKSYLDGDGYAVGGMVVTVVGGLVDAGSEQQTERDGPLVSADDGTTDGLWSDLGHVPESVSGFPPLPRWGRGADMITMAETNPTPKPATMRPPTSTPTVVEATCRDTPPAKMAQAMMMDRRRPIQSARLPPKRAPKKVPAERIDVIKLFSQVSATVSALH